MAVGQNITDILISIYGYVANHENNKAPYAISVRMVWVQDASDTWRMGWEFVLSVTSL